MPSLTTLITALVLATPTFTAPSGNLDTRDTTDALLCLYLTNGVNWEGEGQNLCQVAGRCSPVLPDGLMSNVTSAGPSEGAVCFLYSEGNCGGNRSDPIVKPGYADLGEIGFDKQTESWECWGWSGEDASSSSVTSSMTSSSSIASFTKSATTTKPVVTSTTISGTPVATSSSVAISTAASEVPTRRGAAAGAVKITTTLSGPQPKAPIGQGASTSSSTASSAVSISSTLSTPPTSANTTSTIETLGPLTPGPTPFDPLPTSSSTATTLGPLSPGPMPFDALTSSSSTASTFAMTAPTPDPGSDNSTISSSSASTIAAVSITSTASASTIPSIPTPTNLGMFTSVMTMTHTFADGSTALVTTALVEPIVSAGTE
ncbi:hypothetical protein LTR09_001301 [Extremus antarcticus]|uniref:Uncharacterized protein n=1 Tax=Extremus antarcticus TaxID=702011 RepID=A0AAJ0LWV8_9PEZI|nr:hypothetical protein LTR09_001301 [Extremus antarcticus]